MIAAHVCEALDTSNIDAAYQIHRQVQPKPWSKSTFSDCLTSPYYALQVTHQDQLLGYALVLEVVDEATLMDIAVTPSARRQGVGQKLLNSIIDQCRQHSMQTLWLEVRAGNRPAITLYQQAGFEQVEVRKGYYPAEEGREDALIMCLPLVS